MALPEVVISYINENAEREGVPTPQLKDDLFKLGVLDSFSLVDFVSILESQFNIQISDSDVNPENFRSIEVIERYVDSRRGQDR
jgi:acyl carrier protein